MPASSAQSDGRGTTTAPVQAAHSKIEQTTHTQNAKPPLAQAASSLAAPSLTISHDNLSAAITLPAGTALQAVTIGSLILLAKERGIADTTTLRDAITRLLSKASAAAIDGCLPQDFHAVLLQGSPPVHGSDAALTLVQPPTPASIDPNDPRARSTIRIIRRGEIVAHITPASAPHDGEDVRGQVLRANPARPLRTKLDSSVRALADGRVVALRDGALLATQDHLAVIDDFTIEGNVDFATGNVDVPGHALIAGGVADCFTVKATGDIRVQALVDAASLTSGRDMHLHMGAAGRNLAKLVCGRDLAAPCLSGLDIQVARAARIEREIADCTLTAATFEGPGCTLVRGTITAAGGATLGTLGSASGAGACVIVGFHAGFDALARELASARAALAAQADRSTKRLQQLALLAKLSAAQAEEMTQLSYDMMQTKPLIAKLFTSYRTVQERIARLCKPTLSITQRIEPSATVVLASSRGPIIATFTRGARGPLRLEGATLENPFDRLPTGQPKPAREAVIIDELSKAVTPLASIARVEPWPVAANHAQACKVFGLDLHVLLASASMQGQRTRAAG